MTIKHQDVRCEAFTVVKMQAVVFWVVTPWSVAAGYQQFIGPQSRWGIGEVGGRRRVKMEAVRSSEMLVSHCNITWCHNPEVLGLNKTLWIPLLYLLRRLQLLSPVMGTQNSNNVTVQCLALLCLIHAALGSTYVTEDFCDFPQFLQAT
jgi:hypothetical protein